MKNLILAVSFTLLVSCSTTHNHYHNNEDEYVRQEVLNHSYIDNGDHIFVIVKHRNNLNKHQRQKLRHWCNRNYRHHKKRVKCQFVLG